MTRIIAMGSVASFQEVAQADGQYIAVGTGKTEFEKHIAGQPVSVQTVLLALNNVIDEGVVASVGGDIQFGSFRKNGDFKYRGFEIYAGWTVDGDKFWPSGFVELEVPSNKDSKDRFIESCRALIAGA